MKEFIRNFYIKMRYPQSSSWLHLFKGKVEHFSDLTRCNFDENEIVVAHGWWAKREMKRLDGNIIKVHCIHGVINEELAKEAWSENVPKIAVASYLEKEVKNICGQKLTAIIPNGIDTKEYFPSVPENQRDGIGTIFGMGYHKDPKTVLGVLNQLQKRRPEVPIRVFGACRRPKEISSNIYHRLPTLEKARELYSRSLVWFLGSRSEGFSIPILEAMSCGCAVVATDCGGPKDIIEDGENGFLVEPGNIIQIIKRIETLLDNPELRRRFVLKSKETVEKFSWAKSIEKMEKVLKTIADGKQISQAKTI